MEVIDNDNGAAAVVVKKAPDLPWVEKYRPSSLDDLIAHEDIISIRKDTS